MAGLLRTADLRVSPTGRFIQGGFQLCAQCFHGGGISVRRHENLLNAHQCAAPERQIDGGAIPIIQSEETAGRHCKGHDWPSGFARQHDNAQSRDTRALRHVRGKSDVIAVLQRTYHLLERTDAALAMKRAAVIAGAADRTDAEALGCDGVELAVAMPRYQHLGPMAFLGLDERGHEMLAVPEREDRGLLRFDASIYVSRVDSEFVRAPDQPQILGGENPNSALDAATAQQIANQPFQLAGFAS